MSARTSTSRQLRLAVPGSKPPDDVPPALVGYVRAVEGILGWELDVEAVLGAVATTAERSFFTRVVTEFERWRDGWLAVTALGPVGVITELDVFASDAGVSVVRITDLGRSALDGPVEVGAATAVGLVNDAAAALEAVRGRTTDGGNGIGVFDIGSRTTLTNVFYRGGAPRTVARGGDASTRVEVSLEGLELVEGRDRYRLAGWELTSAGVAWRDLGGGSGVLDDDGGVALSVLAPGAFVADVRPVALSVVFGELLVGLRDVLSAPGTGPAVVYLAAV